MGHSASAQVVYGVDLGGEFEDVEFLETEGIQYVHHGYEGDCIAIVSRELADAEWGEVTVLPYNLPKATYPEHDRLISCAKMLGIPDPHPAWLLLASYD